MLTILLYTLVGYLLLCYGWGLYIAFRIYTGRRLRSVIRLRKPASRIAMATGGDVDGSVDADAVATDNARPATGSPALPASPRRKAAA